MHENFHNEGTAQKRCLFKGFGGTAGGTALVNCCNYYERHCFPKLGALYKKMGATEVDYNEVKWDAQDVANMIIESAVEINANLEYKNLRESIRTAGITLSEKDRKEMSHYVDGGKAHIQRYACKWYIGIVYYW